MRPEILLYHAARSVTPRALREYAKGISLIQNPKINGKIMVFHREGSPSDQVVIPLDESLDDYPEMVSNAIVRLAYFENRPAAEVLEHLLLPPADLLRFRDTSPSLNDDTISLAHAENMIVGMRKALLSQAHSVVKPQPYHPRLSRGEAEQFVDTCRFGQTRKGSFVMTLACPLDTPRGDDAPFARQVTSSIMNILSVISKAAYGGNLDELLSREKYPLLNANFCEALLLMRPDGSHPSLEVSANWSRSLTPPNAAMFPSSIKIDDEAFKVVENIGPRLKNQSKMVPDTYYCYAEILRGSPGLDGRVSGEVVLSLLGGGDETFRARADLNADDYATAADAHLHNTPLLVRGEVEQLPRLSRMASISVFIKWPMPSPAAGVAPPASE